MSRSHSFHSLAAGLQTVTVCIDGDRVLVPEGQTVAEPLISHGLSVRSHGRGGARAPHCMKGVCFECLVTIDGTTSQQGCLVEVADGMDIWRQLANG